MGWGWETPTIQWKSKFWLPTRYICLGHSQSSQGKCHLPVSNAASWASQLAPVVKNPLANGADTETRVQSLSWEDPLEEAKATYSRALAWWTPWTEKSCEQVSTQARTVRHVACQHRGIPSPPKLLRTGAYPRVILRAEKIWLALHYAKQEKLLSRWGHTYRRKCLLNIIHLTGIIDQKTDIT